MVRDEPLSKRCISGQRFCSAAIASKLIGVAAAMTSPTGSGGTKNLQQHFKARQIPHLHIEFRN
jgi:hypothetical protein